VLGVLAVTSAWRSLERLPAWRDNRSQLLTLLADHPESYRAHGSAAAVLAGIGDTAGARREYRIADSLFPADPYLDAAHAIFLLGLGDTAAAAPLIARGRTRPSGPADRLALRARFLWELRRGDRLRALAVVDTALRRFTGEAAWYRSYLP
jgi:Flp pilus assembly protein TadD